MEERKEALSGGWIRAHCRLGRDEKAKENYRLPVADLADKPLHARRGVGEAVIADARAEVTEAEYVKRKA